MDVNFSRFQAGVSKHLLYGFQARLVLHVMRGEGVPQGMNGSVLNPCQLEVLLNGVLNGSGGHAVAEFGQEKVWRTGGRSSHRQPPFEC